MEEREKLVLFDIGSTLLHLNFQVFSVAASELSKYKTSDEFMEAYRKSGIDIQIMMGKMSTGEYFKELRKVVNPKREVLDSELRIVFGKSFGAPIKEMIELKKRLHNFGYTVGLFSDIAELSYGILKERYPEIFEYSDIDLFSYKLGEMKSGKAGFEKVKRYDVVLIDDKIKYLENSRLYGWKFIWFRPYIDKYEPLRIFQGEAKVTDYEYLRIADSGEEVEDALRSFGIDI